LSFKLLNIVQRYAPALGGSELYFQKLSEHLASKGNSITVWTSNARELESFWSANHKLLPASENLISGVKVKRFPLLQFPFQRLLLKVISKIPIRNLQCLTFAHNPIMPQMLKMATQTVEKFDAVHAGCFPYAYPIYVGMKLARAKKIPFLLTPFLHLGDLKKIHNKTRKGYTHPALLLLAKNADAIFAQTPVEAQVLEDLGIQHHRIHLQGMGVDLASCTGGNSEIAKKHWQIKANEVVVGHLANLSWDKGSTDLLQAMEILWQKEIQVKLVLAGPSMPSFEKLYRNFPFKEKVIRTGPLSEEDKRDFFSGLNIFALPSRSDSFGIVLLEAWANSKPCIVYNAGGPGSLIQHESDGLIVECDNISKLATSLEQLITNQELSAKLGRAGLQRVSKEFLWEQKFQIFENALSALL